MRWGRKPRGDPTCPWAPQRHPLPPPSPPWGSAPRGMLRPRPCGLHPSDPAGARAPPQGGPAPKEPSRRPVQEPRGPRSPAVLGALVSFVEQFFETVGISLAERQVRPCLLGPRRVLTLRRGGRRCPGCGFIGRAGGRGPRSPPPARLCAERGLGQESPVSPAAAEPIPAPLAPRPRVPTMPFTAEASSRPAVGPAA